MCVDRPVLKVAGIQSRSASSHHMHHMIHIVLKAEPNLADAVAVLLTSQP